MQTQVPAKTTERTVKLPVNRKSQPLMQCGGKKAANFSRQFTESV